MINLLKVIELQRYTFRAIAKLMQIDALKKHCYIDIVPQRIFSGLILFLLFISSLTTSLLAVNKQEIISTTNKGINFDIFNKNQISTPNLIDSDLQSDNLQKVSVSDNISFELQLEEISATLNKYFKDLDLIKQDIIEKNYSIAIFALNDLSARLREHQKKIIMKYFPSTYKDFKEWNPSFKYDVNYSYSDDIGLLFSKKYRNLEGYTIDVNVVYSDPAIEEYINLIKNQDLVDSIENLQIIKVGRYDALEKFSAEEGYCERNIIINDSLLLNIIANGIEDKSVMEEYTRQINIEGLEYYLIR